MTECEGDNCQEGCGNPDSVYHGAFLIESPGMWEARSMCLEHLVLA